MRPIKLTSFKAHVAMLLRDLPRGTTADLTDVAVAYWNGKQVVGAYLRDNGRIDEEFDFVDENAWGNWRDEFLLWFEAPCFSERSDLKAAICRRHADSQRLRRPLAALTALFLRFPAPRLSRTSDGTTLASSHGATLSEPRTPAGRVPPFTVTERFSVAGSGRLNRLTFFTAIVFIVLGAMLAAGGAYLVTLKGSWYYMSVSHRVIISGAVQPVAADPPVLRADAIRHGRLLAIAATPVDLGAARHLAVDSVGASRYVFRHAIALHATSGKEKWRYDPQIQSTIGFKHWEYMTCRGVAYYDPAMHAATATPVEASDAVAASDVTPGDIAVLHAYDAGNLASKLYSSNQAGSRDQFGQGNKFITPMIAHGKVCMSAPKLASACSDSSIEPLTTARSARSPQTDRVALLKAYSTVTS
ncbi:Glucose dehydrogenase, PQQ-dependent [Candidatus Burkholderia brachyanthoides]|nr:Glucose dehydrogenase, PQQ-dependent [Candidatus Burkholderia brachyanthoides]